MIPRDLVLAFSRANLEQSRSGLALMFANELLTAVGCEIPKIRIGALKKRQSKDTAASAKIAAISAGYGFQVNPTPETYSKWVKAHVRAHSQVSLIMADQRAQRLPALSQTAPLPDKIPPVVRHCCSTSLEWQTNPSIGQNPANLVEFGSSRKPAALKSVTCNSSSVTTLTIYHKGNPTTDEYPSVGAAILDADELEGVSWMICVDAQMIHFHSVTGA